MSSDGATVVATVIVYQAALLAIGWWARGRVVDNEAYFIGSRRLGAWVASLSYAAGSSSAWSILGVTGIAFSQGLSAVWLLPGTLTGHVLVWFWLGRRLNDRARDGRFVTLNDFIVAGVPETERARILLLAASIIAFAFLFYVAAQFQGAANTFAEVLGLGFTEALLVGAAVVLVYTLLGGFWAVSVTDSLQGALMLVAAVLLPVASIADLGGLDALFASLSPAQLSLTGGNRGLLAAGFLLGMVSIGFGPLGQPHLLNRVMALRDVAAFRRARLVALTWFVLVLGGMFLLGLSGHAHLREVADPERLLFALTADLLPPVWAGVVIAAVLSAIMSTADSQLLVAASALNHDLLRRPSLTLARLTVIGLGALAVLVALYLPEAIFSRVLFAWNALGAAFGPVVVARVLGWRLAPRAVSRSMAAGFGLTVALYLLPDTPGDVAERALPFAAALLLVLAGRLR